MDKFVVEQLTYIKELADELQACFIDDDAYSRTPSPTEWRRAGRTVRQISLACHELFGYASACRILYIDDARNSLRVVSSTQIETKTPGDGIIPFSEVLAWAKGKGSVRREQKPTLQEINDMLIELNIKQKARLRSDGLFEIRPTIGGQRISLYGHTAEELSEKFKQALMQPTKGTSKAKINLFAWLDEWLEVYKKPNVAKSTYKNLEQCIRCYIKKGLSDKPLNRYTVTELTQMLNGIESTRMRKYTRGTLRDSFRCAVVAGHIKASPAESLLPVKHVVQKGKAIALLDLKKMIEDAAVNIPRCAWLYFVATLFSGARRTESLEITAKDCDFKNHILLLHGTKTDGSLRRLPMFPILEKIFRACDGSPPDNVFSCSLWQANHYFPIFCGAESQATLHWLRHTFGTVHICVNGIPVNTVAHWMGHSDAKTTMDTYTHPEDLAPDIYYSGKYSEEEKLEILKQRWKDVIETVERLL